MEAVRGSGDGSDRGGQQVATEVQSTQVSCRHLPSQAGVPMVLDGIVSPESSNGFDEIVSEMVK